MTDDTSKKKYILKPGLHQFAPDSAAIHNNDNLSDEEAKWYLQRYPHIAKLFTPQPPEGGVIIQPKNTRKSTANEVSGKGGSV